MKRVAAHPHQALEPVLLMVMMSNRAPPPPIDPSLQPVPWANRWFGNPWLWTRLPQAGVLPVYQDEAGLGTKFPWWGGYSLAACP